MTVAEVFVDAGLAAASLGEAGVTLSSGLRAGPNCLSEILCTGRIRVVYSGEDGKPIGVSDLSAAIPPALHSYVWWRDQGVCVIDGCRSRYRLQPHHIRERSQGGDHDPDNLALLVGFIIMSPSTGSDIGSTPTPHPNADDSPATTTTGRLTKP